MRELKKHWSGSRGKEAVLTGGPLAWLEVDMVRLEPGDAVRLDESGKDFTVIVLDGEITVTGADFGGTLKRESVFSEPADGFFIPRNRAFTLGSDQGGRAAVAKSPAAADFAPRLVRGAEARVKTLGKGAYTREASFLVAENVDCNLFYIGEFWVQDGGWASWPPHKHDEDDMPAEGLLEEIYYFEFDRPSGFGVQMVYDKQGTFDEAYRVRGGDMVAIPCGYHPFACAPGYKNYCLWIMAGRDRGIFCTTEEGHKWQTTV